LESPFSTTFLFFNTPELHGTDAFMRTEKQTGLCDQVAEAICTSIRRVREIFAERPTGTATDSIPKPTLYFDIL
jgi:hypothetical protein